MSHNLTPTKAVRVAKRVAGQSIMRYKLGSCLYDRKQYVTGYNRAFGVFIDYYERKWSIHAEEMAIVKGVRVGIDFSNSTLVVVRVNRRGDLRVSEPCDTCVRLIEDVGIKTVWYVG